MQTIHPLVIYAPVAMLFIYGLVEICSRIPLFKRFDFTLTKTILITVGFIGGVVSSLSGEAIEHSFRGIQNLVEMHSTFAFVTNVIAGIIFVIYAKITFGPIFIEKIQPGTKLHTWSIRSINFWKKIQNCSLLMIILAIGVMATITVTGALGAAIVHGPEIDPVVKLLYTTLIGN